jgi:hypothetical protein
MTDHEKRVDELVESLGCSIFEAEEILKADKTIDKGGRTEFDLSKEEEKRALKYANVKTKKKPMIPNLTKRERKPDPTKEGVIQAVFEFLQENGYADCEITNKTKLISFKIADDSYEFNLIRKRKPKN